MFKGLGMNAFETNTVDIFGNVLIKEGAEELKPTEESKIDDSKSKNASEIDMDSKKEKYDIKSVAQVSKSAKTKIVSE